MSRITGSPVVTRLRARVVGTPTAAMYSEARNSRTEERSTARPSANLQGGAPGDLGRWGGCEGGHTHLLYGVWPAPLSWSSQRSPSLPTVCPIEIARPSPSWPCRSGARGEGGVTRNEKGASCAHAAYRPAPELVAAIRVSNWVTALQGGVPGEDVGEKGLVLEHGRRQTHGLQGSLLHQTKARFGHRGRVNGCVEGLVDESWHVGGIRVAGEVAGDGVVQSERPQGSDQPPGRGGQPPRAETSRSGEAGARVQHGGAGRLGPRMGTLLLWFIGSLRLLGGPRAPSPAPRVHHIGAGRRGRERLSMQASARFNAARPERQLEVALEDRSHRRRLSRVRSSIDNGTPPKGTRNSPQGSRAVRLRRGPFHSHDHRSQRSAPRWFEGRERKFRSVAAA